MADSKISALTEATSLAATDEFVIASAGTTKRVTFETLREATILYHTDPIVGNGNLDSGVFSTSYKHLLIFALLRSTEVTTEALAAFRFNVDTGGNYDRQIIRVDNATVTGAIANAATEMSIITLGSSALANSYSSFICSVPGYSQTTTFKAMTWQIAAIEDTAADSRSENGSSLWRSTAAISRFGIFAASGTMAAGSQLTIYGL